MLIKRAKPELRKRENNAEPEKKKRWWMLMHKNVILMNVKRKKIQHQRD